MLWICKRVSIWILDYTLIQREESRSFVFSIVTRVWQFTLRSKKLTFFKTVLESRSFPCPKYFLPFYNQWYFHSEIDSNYDDLRFLDFASFRFKNVKEKKKGLDSFPRVFFDPWSDKLRHALDQESRLSSRVKKTLKRRIITTTYFRDHKGIFFFNLFQR